MKNKERSQNLILIISIFIVLSASIWYKYRNDIDYSYHVRYDLFTTSRYFVTEGFREGRIVPLQSETDKKLSDYQNICETIHPSHLIGYPILLSPVVWIFGDNIAPPTIFNALISIVAIYVFFVLVSLFCSKFVSAVSTLLFSTNFDFLLIAASTYQQNCEILLILLMLLNLFKIKSYPLMFALFFFASIIGPTSLAISIILLLVMFVRCKNRSADWPLSPLSLLLLIIPIAAGVALHVLSTIDACGDLGIRAILDSFTRRTNLKDTPFRVNPFHHDFYIKVFVVNTVYCFGPTVFFLTVLFLFNLIEGNLKDVPGKLLLFLFVPPAIFLAAFYNVTYYHSYYYCLLLAVPVAAAIELENMKNILFRNFMIITHFMFVIYYIMKIHS